MIIVVLADLAPPRGSAAPLRNVVAVAR